MKESETLTHDPNAWQYAMIVIGIVCCSLFILTFAMTRENVKTQIKDTNVLKDLGSLLHNSPWWILLGGVLFFNFFNAIRYAAIPFYFTTLIAADAQLSIFSIDFLFYSGIFLAVGEIANMIGVAAATPITFAIGKKNTFLWSLFALIGLCIAFYFVPTSGTTAYWTLFALQILVCILTGVISPLVWSMYADISDYAELKFKTASTGLIFSSSSMAQKFGGAFGAAAVMWILAGFGFDTAVGAVQTQEAVHGIQLLMSWIPAGIALISAFFIFIYPLTTKRMKEINAQLKEFRNK